MRSGHLEIPGKRQKVLLVDDNEQSLQTLMLLCEAMDMDPVAADCGASALQELEHNQFAMVITDVRMPQMSGIKLLHTIKESQPQLPVVLLSGFELNHYEQIIASHYANGVLAKPVSVQTLQTLFNQFGL